MGKRLRFASSNEENVYVSTRKFSSDKTGATYKVILNAKDNTYTVVDDMIDIVAASGEAKSLKILKERAKDALSALGVEFDKEERAKRNVL